MVIKGENVKTKGRPLKAQVKQPIVNSNEQSYSVVSGILILESIEN